MKHQAIRPVARPDIERLAIRLTLAELEAESVAFVV
jgi:hypothetical protein